MDTDNPPDFKLYMQRFHGCGTLPELIFDHLHEWGKEGLPVDDSECSAMLQGGIADYFRLSSGQYAYDSAPVDHALLRHVTNFAKYRSLRECLGSYVHDGGQFPEHDIDCANLAHAAIDLYHSQQEKSD